MNKIQSTFNKNKVFLPVIHIENELQVMKNVALAKEANADGVFLIDHSGQMSPLEILKLDDKVVLEFDDFWTGINFLNLSSLKAMEFSVFNGIHGLWCDNAHIDENSETQSLAKDINLTQQLAIEDIIYFGGIAFKYQKPVNNYKKSAKIAKDYVDVITTSGSGTGYSADLDKIKEMYDGADGHPLGLASGVTPDNAFSYLPYVDVFLVSTGISVDFHNLDFNKTKELSDIIHSYE